MYIWRANRVTDKPYVVDNDEDVYGRSCCIFITVLVHVCDSVLASRH